MMSITEKLAYIRGLCEGLKLDESTNEGKILLAIVDLLDATTQMVSNHEVDIDQIYDELDAIDEDLTDVEDFLLDEDEEFEDDECECGCHHHEGHECGHHHGEHGCHCHHHDDEEEWDDEDWDEDWDLEENPLYEITCPNCGETVCMDEDTLFSEDGCFCPNCGVEFEIEEVDEEEAEDETEE